MKRPNCIVGIDPGMKTTGIAWIVQDQHKFLNLDSGHLIDMMNTLLTLNGNFEIIVALEDPTLQSAVFAARMPKTNDQFRKELSKAQKIGKLKAATELIKETMIRSNIKFYCIAPSERDSRKNPKKAKMPIEMLRMPTKVSKKEFDEYMKYTGKSTEHSRDGATLIRGINWKQAELNYKIQSKTRK